MSSNQRPQANVGVGSLREADDLEFTINEGWNLFQKHLPDDSVIDSEPFSFNADPLSGDGPYIINIPRYPDCFLDPSSLRLNGTVKIVHKKNNKIQAKLPEAAAEIPNPLAPFQVKFVPETDQATLTTNKTKSTAQLLTTNTLPFYNESTKTVDYLKIEHVQPDMERKLSKVVPVNMMCQAMWRDVEIKMNGLTVTKNANLEYPYKAMFETLLTYSPDALNTHMKSEMWCPDDFEEMADYEDEGDNFFETKYAETKSFLLKEEQYSRNEEFDFSMQLHTELNSINGFLLDDIAYQIKLLRNDPSFFLRTQNTADCTGQEGGQYTVEFTRLSVSGVFMKPSPSVREKIKKAMAHNDATYKTVRTSILTQQVMKGASSYLFNNIFSSDHLPDQIFVAMVDMNAKNGDIGKDPFKFDHFNVNSIRLQVNNKSFPVEALTPNFEKNNYITAFKHLYENSSIKTNNVGLSITPLSFAHGNTIFGWDLNHDGCAGAHSNHSDLYGAAALYLNFSKPLDQNICIIVAAVHRDYLTVDKWGRPDVISSYGIAKLFEDKKMAMPA